MRDQQTGVNFQFEPMSPLPFPISLPAPMTPPTPTFCAENIKVFGVKVTKGSERKKSWAGWWRFAEGCCGYFYSPGSLPPFLGRLSIWPNILHFMWNCLESAVLNRFPLPDPNAPQSRTFDDWRSVFWERKRPGRGGRRWSSRRATVGKINSVSSRLSTRNQGSKEYADHVCDTITEMLSIMRGVRLIKPLMPFRIVKRRSSSWGLSATFL